MYGVAFKLPFFLFSQGKKWVYGLRYGSVFERRKEEKVQCLGRQKRA